MSTAKEILRELRPRIGDTMLHNALNTDGSVARAKLGDEIVRKIKVRIDRGGDAIEAANDCHLDIPPSDLARWAMFYRIAAECIAERENAAIQSSPAPA